MYDACPKDSGKYLSDRFICDARTQRVRGTQSCCIPHTEDGKRQRQTESEMDNVTLTLIPHGHNPVASGHSHAADA